MLLTWSVEPRILTSILQVLTAAYSDLKHVKDNITSSRGGTEKAYLADDKTRELFAEGLVEVLDRDTASAPQPILNEDRRGGGRGGGGGGGGGGYGGGGGGGYGRGRR